MCFLCRLISHDIAKNVEMLECGQSVDMLLAGLSRARETIIAGLYHDLIQCAEIDFGEGGNAGRGVP